MIVFGKCGHPLRGDPMAIDYDGCRVCFLVAASSAAVRWHDDERAHGGARRIFAEFIRATREWHGREDEANAWRGGGIFAELTSKLRGDVEHAHRTGRWPDGAVHESRYDADLKVHLAGNPHRADDHVGYTRTEVDAAIARITPVQTRFINFSHLPKGAIHAHDIRDHGICGLTTANDPRLRSDYDRRTALRELALNRGNHPDAYTSDAALSFDDENALVFEGDGPPMMAIITEDER